MIKPFKSFNLSKLKDYGMNFAAPLEKVNHHLV